MWRTYWLAHGQCRLEDHTARLSRLVQRVVQYPLGMFSLHLQLWCGEPFRGGICEETETRAQAEDGQQLQYMTVLHSSVITHLLYAQ